MPPEVHDKVDFVGLCADCGNPMTLKIPPDPVAKAIAEKMTICDACARKARRRMKRWAARQAALRAQKRAQRARRRKRRGA